ncbi:hypothetical protein Pmar_PMAR007719 [Perkinsus marinus ATCC 50983]|uniref:Uncharacterized protein n=1 Tax=Perkinsus marinus (strain ATCC 50983 / TXsc) TaxID=423536 RepID=C5LGS3_PERM5|nr:hypothetical protein Pmar_PMAR007719 [Perkinsus marinus ATCC 50983]EER04071.1 hypothetical protein Pmar_PMAR007719 [Perkinsus marinus ATCC 50983]|eukprot:XP_002772255.1 hypothetical protein Pmar_PMAR007719 [Perkinsus marinus ATCC 50983]
MDWGTDLTSSPKDNLDEGATQEEINAKNEAWKKKAAERESRRIQEREQWQNNFANKVGLGLIIRKCVIVRLSQTKQVTESLEFPNDVPSVPALDSARAASEDSGTDAPDDEGQSAASPSEDHATGGTSEGATSGGDEEASHEEGDGAPTESSSDGVVEAAPSESYIQKATLKGNSSIETTIVEKNKNDSPKPNSFVDLDVLHPSVVDAAIYKRAQNVLDGFHLLRNRVQKLGELTKS